MDKEDIKIVLGGVFFCHLNLVTWFVYVFLAGVCLNANYPSITNWIMLKKGKELSV